MLTITVSKDGVAKSFVLKSAVEATIASIISEPGSPYASEAELITAFLQDNALRQWLLRYPTPTLNQAFVRQSQAGIALNAIQNTPEIDAARLAKTLADADVSDALNAAIADWKV